MSNKPAFFTLLLLISFASVNAVLFTPALPSIALFFNISIDKAQLTVSWFLIGYALGQLLYGPIANRYGRKPALFTGILLQIVSSLLCVLAGEQHQYWLLVLARFMQALGSGVGLKMTFTLINECYEPKIASQKTAHLMLAFAITPALSVALGGLLNSCYGWESCFMASAIYGLLLLLFVARLPETLAVRDRSALTLNHLLRGYSEPFKNRLLVSGGLLMGSATSFVYVFAAISPFIAINMFGLTSSEYGLANLLPPIGLILGSIVGAKRSKLYSFKDNIRLGLYITSVGTALMLLAMLLQFRPLYSLFLPMIIIYFGLCFLLANASAFAMSHTLDKAHGSAVMNFINMGLATIIVLGVGLLTMQPLLLPIIYGGLCIASFGLYKFTSK